MGFDFSLDGGINRTIFYRRFNDINFFFEDQDKEFEYEIVINRLFEGSLQVNKIFGVGGKRKLIEAYQDLKNNPNGQLNIFVSDLDFDKVLGNLMITDDTFIYLDHYCIENYLIDETPTVYFIQGRIGKLEKEVKEIIKFNEWFKLVTNQFYELFILFLVVQKNGLGIPNTKSALPFLVNNSWEVDEEKVENYYNKLKKNLNNLDDQITAMKEHIKNTTNDICCIISGKFYFDSLKKYLRNFSNGSIIDKDLRIVLFRHFDVSKLEFLKQQVLVIKQKYYVAS